MTNRQRPASDSLQHVARVGAGSAAGRVGGCACFIVPVHVLERFAKDEKLTADQRRHFVDAVNLEQEWRKARVSTAKLAHLTHSILPTAMSAAAAASAPSVLVFDSKNGNTLPGSPVADPGASTDGSAKRAFNETTSVVEFYRKVFGRNSLDGAGMTLMSSIHFSVRYNNAAWNGSQMFYGDGDGSIFIDFTRSKDVIGHELTHGVTQFTSGFSYFNQAGGLNESMSDVFGSMYRQWRAKQSATAADWLIGKEIMGPGATARGLTCLRDLSNPAAGHCLSPQPTRFSQYRNGMDPHESSGIPNFAFYKAAMAIGGKSWEKAGRIWYKALTGFAPSPNMKMKTFANRTRKLAGSMFPAEPAVKAAVDEAWTDVGL